jgi:hypothetical protein
MSFTHEFIPFIRDPNYLRRNNIIIINIGFNFSVKILLMLN